MDWSCCFGLIAILLILPSHGQDDSTVPSSTLVTTRPPPTTPPPTPAPDLEITLTEDPFEWKPRDNSFSSHVTVHVDKGYSIIVKVSEVSISAEQGNYLLIKGGGFPLDKKTDGRRFTNNVAEYKCLYRADTVTGLYVNNNSLVYRDDRFSVVFERSGEISTTISTTTQLPDTWPTTEAGDSMFLTVNVSGKTVREFADPEVEQKFRDSVARMAQVYCKDEAINLVKNITDENVILSTIFGCPITWPDYTKCVQITFRLPIFYNSPTLWAGYQMTTYHLQIMWDRYASTYLGSGMGIYKEPNVDKIITWWIVGIVLVVVALVVLLWFLRRMQITISSYMLRHKMRGDGDTKSIISSKGSSSEVSMDPHYLQFKN